MKWLGMVAIIMFAGAASPAAAECGGLKGAAADPLAVFAKANDIGDIDRCAFYGDFSGDGRDDVLGVFFTGNKEGGNSFYINAYLFLRANHGYPLLREVEMYGVDPRRPSFAEGRVEITTRTMKDGDARCCPSGETRWIFKAE